jgi:hypothetical protein
MTAIPFEAGARVVLIAPDGTALPRRATGDESHGHVWVCREEEWNAAQRERRAPETVPWPSKHVRLADGHFANPF